MSHVYMCSAEHRGNYRNLLTHTLDPPPYVGLEVLPLIVALLAKTALIKTIISLSKKLSIVFVRYLRHTIELSSHKTLDCSIPRKGENNKMSAWDLPIPVNQSSRLVHTFPNELPDSLFAIKEHGCCTYIHAVPT